MEKLVRFANVELRASQDDKDSRTIEGVAAVFNEVADMGWFDEKIDPHAFDKCDMSNVVLNLNHNDSDLLAGTRNKSLKLKVTDKGLEQKSSIIDTNTGNDALKLVRSGLITQMSFAFEIDRDGGQVWEIKEGDDKEHRTILKVKKLYDVSLVTFPAYEGTSVAARSAKYVDDLANEHLAERQKGESSMEKRDGNVSAENNQPEANQEPAAENNDVNTNNTPVEDPAAQVDDTSKPSENAGNEPAAEENGERAKQTEKENRSMGKENQLSLDKSLAQENVENRAANLDAKDTKEIRQAYKDACLGHKSLEEYRALFSTTEGMPIPTYLDTKVQTAWEKADTFIKRVFETHIRGIIAVPVEAEADDAVVHKEGTDAPPEENLTLTQVILMPAAVKKWISYSDILESLTPEEFMDYLVEEVIYRVYKKANLGIITSAIDDDGNGIVGVVDAELTEEITAPLGFNVFNEAAAELEGEDETIAVMNKKTFLKNYLSLVDLQGKPIFVVQNDNEGKPHYFANGMPVEFCSTLPVYDSAQAGQVWAVVGDFSGYRLNTPFGHDVTIIRDNITEAKKDKEAIIGKMIAAGNVYKPKKFVNIKMPTSA